MLCPECKSRSLVQKDGQKKCQAKGCTFIQFHIISYDNENRQFEGQKGTQNRFNSINYTSQNGDKDSYRYQRNVDRVRPVIRELAKAMKLCNDTQQKAEAKLTQILKIKYPQDKDAQKQWKQGSKQKSQKQKKQQKLQVTDKNIAAYCLWLACCDKGMEFKDVRIANQMGITKEQWHDIHTKMENKFKTMMNIPPVNPAQFIRRICRKRKIDKVEEDAMLQMAKRIQQAQIKGGKRNATVAACIFWQIMKRSSRYNDENGCQFDIKKYIEKSSRNSDGKPESIYWTQSQFDISYDSIRKFLLEDIGHRLQYFIPDFQTRVPEQKIKALDQRSRN